MNQLSVSAYISFLYHLRTVLVNHSDSLKGRTVDADGSIILFTTVGKAAYSVVFRRTQFRSSCYNVLYEELYMVRICRILWCQQFCLCLTIRGGNKEQTLCYCSSVNVSGICTLLEYLSFWQLSTFPPYIWTQISVLSPNHILKTDSLLLFECIWWELSPSQHHKTDFYPSVQITWLKKSNQSRLLHKHLHFHVSKELALLNIPDFEAYFCSRDFTLPLPWRNSVYCAGQLDQ